MHGIDPCHDPLDIWGELQQKNGTLSVLAKTTLPAHDIFAAAHQILCLPVSPDSSVMKRNEVKIWAVLRIS